MTTDNPKRERARARARAMILVMLVAKVDHPCNPYVNEASNPTMAGVSWCQHAPAFFKDPVRPTHQP